METRTSYELLRVEDIHLDYKNPRIAKYVEMYGTEQLTSEQLHLALGAGSSEQDSNTPTFSSLEQSIKTQGGIIHPILVNKETGGRLIVIEGNTRVAIYRSFLAQQYKGNWETIPSIIYESLNPSEIDAIRLQSHLVGARPWDAYSKAKFLHALSNSDHLPMSQIVEFCGNRPKEVKTYISAYEDMEKYYRPRLASDGDFDHTRFSAFVELQNLRVKEAVLKEFGIEDFSQWVIDHLIYPLSTVRQLPRILADEESKRTFLKEGAGAAINVLSVPPTEASLKDASLQDLAIEISRRIREISYDQFKTLRSEQSGSKAQAIFDAQDQLSELCMDIQEG